MFSSRIRRWRTAVRESPLGPRLAVALWAVWAFTVWNVVFDRVLVLAGRQYVYAAAVSARDSNAYLKIDDWMHPAVTRGVWTASLAGGGIFLAGLVLVRVATTRRRPSTTLTESPRRS